MDLHTHTPDFQTAQPSSRPGPVVALSDSAQVVTLPNGLRIATDHLAHERAVAIGFCIDTGSIDEDPSTLGKSHFLEHLCFRSADGRDARSLAHDIESVGGDFGAATGLGRTMFYARVPARHATRALATLSSVVWRPDLAPEGVDTERQVIANEMRMYADIPGSVVADTYDLSMFPDHPYGRPILGTPDSLEHISVGDLRAWHEARYLPANVVVSVAGCIDPDEIRELVAAQAPTGGGRPPSRTFADPGAPVAYQHVPHPSEQAHLLMGWRSLADKDPDRYAVTVLLHALDGGMSTRLFHEVREQRGLCYSIGFWRRTYHDQTVLTADLSTAPEHAREALRVTHDTITDAVVNGITDKEFHDAVEAARGALEMRTITAQSSMWRMGDGVLQDNYLTIAEEIDKISAVTPEQLASVSRRLFTSDGAVCTLGPEATDADALGADWER